MEVKHYYSNTSLCQPTNFELFYDNISFCNHSENTVSQNKDIFSGNFVFRCKCREEIPETTQK